MPTVLAVDPDAPDPAAIAAAAAVLRAGGLVAFPTETVYGLGADARDAAAVARIFAAKGRPADDPIIVHVLDAAMLGPAAAPDAEPDRAAGGDGAIVAAWPPVAARLAEAFWPGPLTLVVPRGPAIPPIVTAGLDAVAVRAPAHPVARALLAAAALPIAAPSANPFGRTSPTTAAHVLAGLGDRVDLVLDGGPCPVGVESTVVDCTVGPPRLLRPGGIALEALRAVVPAMDHAGPVRAAPPAGASVHAPSPSPGTQARHYAPRAPLVLVTGADTDVLRAVAAAARRLVAGGRRVGLVLAEGDAVDPAGAAVIVRLAAPDDPATAARRLFAALHDLDDAAVDVILARDWPPAGLGLALRDRLRRAAAGRVVPADPRGDAVLAALAAADRPFDHTPPTA